MPIERKYWTLLVLNAAGSNGLSPVQLQKCLFLIGQNLSHEVGDSFYSFVPYNYGPFDPAIYADAQRLVDEKLATVARVAGKNWAYYVITTEGKEVAHTISISSQARAYIDEVVQWVLRLSFAQLLSAIYQAYPEYKANSVFLR
jgi:hypothetical protein